MSSVLVLCETSATVGLSADGRRQGSNGLTAAITGPQALTIWGGDSPYTRDGGDGDDDDALWFTALRPAFPLFADVSSGWSDGGTLVRVTTTYAASRRNTPGWLGNVPSFLCFGAQGIHPRIARFKTQAQTFQSTPFNNQLTPGLPFAQHQTACSGPSPCRGDRWARLFPTRRVGNSDRYREFRVLFEKPQTQTRTWSAYHRRTSPV